ncbi:MAG: hypothetical protein ACI4O0_09330 [Candidatus Limivicinus sp.]
MKTKRFLSTLLALLLICSLPVSAFATDDIKPGEHRASIDKHDTVINSSGSVDINQGTVENNYGSVEINAGTIGDNCNTGTVSENYGTVTTNGGTVTNNVSSGTVGTNNKTVTNNYGTVTDNAGTVTNNGTETNHDNAKVETNNNTVTHNYGTVDTNNGTVYSNRVGAEVTNNKEGATVTYNYGTVITNDGTVSSNYGTVETNGITGTVNNGESYYGTGTVTTNYGTVIGYGPTHYGVQVEGSLLQKDEGKDLNLAQLFTKAGYVLTGFIQEYGMENGKVTLLDSPTTVSGTSYTADCPNVLTLIWQAIASPAAGETVAADDGAGSFGSGSVISINGHRFLLVAVVEDVYCLAFVDSFEDEALSDLPALLSSLLTEEQLSHVTGEPELLDEELTARFFAGQGSHIVFPCDKDLIFS